MGVSCQGTLHVVGASALHQRLAKKTGKRASAGTHRQASCPVSCSRSPSPPLLAPQVKGTKYLTSGLAFHPLFLGFRSGTSMRLREVAVLSEPVEKMKTTNRRQVDSHKLRRQPVYDAHSGTPTNHVYMFFERERRVRV